MTQALVITGPLGSGKTTILRELMERQRPDGKILLVVNDVGQVNIDAARLGDLGEIESMTAGCIGCSDLGAFLEVMECAKTAGVDHLIVEPTGIADGREIHEATSKAGISMSSVALIDVKHFHRNRALGVMETQLAVAGRIGLTWCDALLDDSEGIAQSDLEEVMTFCGTHAPGKSVSLVRSEPTAFVSDLVRSYLAGTLRVSQSKCCGHDSGCSHNHHHGHNHHDHTRGGHHNHGVFAESGNLPDDFTQESLTVLIAQMGDVLIRAKGVAGGTTFDLTQGSLRFGASSSVEPHATFISTQPLGIIEQHSAVEGTKKQLMRGYQAPLEATLAALEWQLSEYPSNRSLNGEIRVDAEADIIRQLCERPGIPTERRAEAIQQYVKWRLESLYLLVDDGDRWQSHPDLPYWRRRLGGVLCWHAQNVGEVLQKGQIEEMVRLDAPRHALEGLLGITELTFDNERAEERPELITDAIWLATKYEILDHGLVERALRHCLTLSASDAVWHGRWQTAANEFLESA